MSKKRKTYSVEKNTQLTQLQRASNNESTVFSLPQLVFLLVLLVPTCAVAFLSQAIAPGNNDQQQQKNLFHHLPGTASLPADEAKID